jgi:uncharacterized protein YecE (DUF72 family)
MVHSGTQRRARSPLDVWRRGALQDPRRHDGPYGHLWMELCSLAGSALSPGSSAARPPRASYLRRYCTVELNSRYDRWPSDVAFRAWRCRLPDGFCLSVKAPRWLTHVQRLSQPERWLSRIQHSLALLGDHQGVLLVQLSPTLAYDHARLASFLAQVPRALRVSVECRHPSWHQDAVFELLEQHGAAYRVMSGAQLPCILCATARFVYVRWHGPDPQHLYGGSYSDTDLRWWAARIQEWADQGRDVYVYFNNDGHGHAVYNAETLKGLIGH